MKFLSVLALSLALGLSVTSGDAEAAKRLGGGKSTGMQKQSAPADKSPNATPAQTPGAPGAAAAAPAAATGAAAAAAAPKRSWLGPIAGLAAGLGLAALASHLGFGEAFGNMLMIGLLVMAVVAVIAFVMRKRAAAQAGGMGSQGGMQYAGAAAGAGMGSNPATAAPDDQITARTQVDAPVNNASSYAGSGSMIGSSIGANLPAANQGNEYIPADFDTAGFERSAKVQFIRLQASNDAANLDDIREFTTPEMFAEVKMDMADRGNATQHTEVVSVHAKVMDVTEEAQRYVVSVRFTGLIREEPTAQPEAFDELWHLVKPRDGQGGWLLAGIQQYGQ
ncbi:MAG: 39S ribosomal protein L45 [Burkholderiales bacterium]|nr:39S ribosomal protein L45 [Burkholderiales bacterium]